LNGNAQDQLISNGVTFDGEPYLTINPTNSQHMVVAWMGHVPLSGISIKSKTSFDGGTTWSNEVIIPHEFTGLSTTSADPSIEFDNQGNVYLCYVDYNVLTISGAVFVRKSTDGGLNWGMPVEVINIDSDGPNKPADRPWMKIDRSLGVNSGNVYVTTMSPQVFGPIPAPHHPYFIHSNDGGLSFESWQYLDTTGWLAGSLIPQPTPFPTISSNGIFHCVYPSFLASQSFDAQYFLASTSDAGNTFSYNLITAQPSSSLVTNPKAKRGYPLIADPSNNEHLIFLSLLKIHGDADVFIWETFDSGITWSDPIRINDDPIGNDRMQDLIWGNFDNDGDLIVTWRDRRNAIDSTYETSSEIWGAVRLNDSTGFQPNFRLSDTIAAYDSVLASGGNDFMSVELLNDTIYAAWGDTRNGSLSIWYKKMYIDGTTTDVQQISSEKLPRVNIYPNPTASTIWVEGENLENVIVYDLNGDKIISKHIESAMNKIEINLNDFPNGTYFIQASTLENIVTKRVLKQ